MAVEILSRALFAGGQAHTVIAVELPKSHAMMHLDTVMTMIDRGIFVLYPYIDRHFRSWTVTAGEAAGELRVAAHLLRRAPPAPRTRSATTDNHARLRSPRWTCRDAAC